MRLIKKQPPQVDAGEAFEWSHYNTAIMWHTLYRYGKDNKAIVLLLNTVPTDQVDAREAKSRMLEKKVKSKMQSEASRYRGKHDHEKPMFRKKAQIVADKYDFTKFSNVRSKELLAYSDTKRESILKDLRRHIKERENDISLFDPVADELGDAAQVPAEVAEALPFTALDFTHTSLSPCFN